MRKVMVAILLPIAACGCRDSEPTNAPTRSATSMPGMNARAMNDVSLDVLLAAPEQVNIDGRKYTLMARLQRDFMPVNPDTSLRCYPSVRASGPGPFPATLDADLLWVINRKEVWKTQMEDLGNGGAPNALAKKAWGGPKWEPPAYPLTAVVRVRNKQTGQAWLLRASNLGILATH